MTIAFSVFHICNSYCEAASLTAFTAMCSEEQQISDNLIVKNNCFIIEIFDKFSFSGILGGGGGIFKSFK